jgi:single-strand DNA-binding protein
MNNINLIGRITKDVELISTAGGTQLAKFSVAWNDRNKNAHFFRCTAFNKTAENIAKYFSKGSLIGITGILSQNKWQDKEGNKMESIEIIVNEFSFCGGKSENTNNSNNSQENTDDIPF